MATATVDEPTVERRSELTTPGRTARDQREPLLAVSIGAMGVAFLVVGNALHSHGAADGGLTSNVADFVAFEAPRTFAVAPPILVMLAAICALALATRPRGRATVAGLLAGLGLEGYLLAIPWLAGMLSFDAAKLALAWAGVTVGSALLVTAGAMLYARSEDTSTAVREHAHGLGPAARIIALVGAGAVFVAAFLPVYEPGLSYLDLNGADRWLMLEPLVIAAAAASLVLALGRGRSRYTLGGAVLGLGVIAAMNYLAILVDTSRGEGSPEIGSTVGLIGTGAIALAGLVALATARGTETQQLPADEPGDPRGLRTTRQLAAAAHLDPTFAAKCVREVVKDRHRAVAPSFGLDVVTVLRHSVCARGRQLALTILLGGLALPLGIALVHASQAPLVAVVVVLTAWFAVLVYEWTTRYRIVARHLTESSYDPTFATRHMTPGAERRVREIGHSEGGNLVVYSGFRTHVGCGSDQGGWSFAVNVSSGRAEMDGHRTAPKSFANDELYAHVAERLGHLELDGLTMFERMYVDGETIRDDVRFIADRTQRPRTHLDAVQLAEAGLSPDIARRYHSLTLCSWGGEIVFTTFLRFVRQGTSLYAEVMYYLLAPPREEYRGADRIDPAPLARERLRVAGRAALRTVTLLREAVRAARDSRAAWSAWRRHSRDQRDIARNPQFDFGARTSVRELAQSNDYRRQAQMRDKEMFAKVIDREVLDAIIGFLDGCDIDTSELRERRTAVLNNGVIVTGGQLTSENIAVGTKSKAGSRGKPGPTVKPTT